MEMSKFWNFIKNAATESAPESVELRIEGDIISDDDSWIYEWFGIASASPNAFRNSLSQYSGQDITVWIDSYGGDVLAAAGIYNALKEHKGNINVKIDGKAMSAASVIAMAGDTIAMSPMAIMMIHNPLSAVQGYASDMRKQADVLDTVKESIMNAYCAKTNLPRVQVSSLMDNETYMDAKTAVEQGFADEVLYQDEEEKSDTAIKNFSFNRVAILNCANEAQKSFKRAFELKNIKDKTKIKNASCQCDGCSQNEEDCQCAECGQCEGCCDNPSLCGCNCNEDNSCGNCTIDNCQKKKIKNKKEETIVDEKELKEKFPDVYNAVFNAGISEGIKNEQERLKAIDELDGKVDKEYLNEAKYNQGMTAEKIAFNAMKENKFVNMTYLNNVKKDAQNANSLGGDGAPEGQQEEESAVLSVVNNIASKIAGRITGGR